MVLRIYQKEGINKPIKELGAICPNVWIHVDEASTGDLEELSRLSTIEMDDLIDCIDKYELPRIEHSKERLMIFTRYPNDQERGLYTSTLAFILTQDTLITITPHHSPLIALFIAREQDFSTFERNKLLIDLLLKVNQEFTGRIRKVRYEVLSAEKEMIHVESDEITLLTKHEETLNQYLASLFPTRSVLERIHSGHYTSLYEEGADLIEDGVHSLKQSEELCSIALKSIRSLRDSYQIIFTNNLHKTIKLLTSLTIILSIPTMIASVYGMNVDLPLAKNSFAFGIVMGLTALLSILGLWIFKKRGWL